MPKTSEELTKDWKAGKLKEGNYYVQCADGDIRIEYASKWIHPNSPSHVVNFDDPIMIYKVLAYVPSYDEYKALQDKVNRFKNALKFYAKGRNYKSYLASIPFEAGGYLIKRFFTLKDMGEIAQKALRSESEEK